MGKTVKKLLLLLALAPAAMPPPALAAAGATLYDIEALVFENRQPNLEGGEAWKETARDTAELGQAALAEGLPTPDSALAKAAKALEAGGRHRVLVHRRWQQAAEAKSETTPLRLQSAGRELDGTARFYSSRFLYVELNLILQGAGEAYPLAEQRRVRLQEIHYFDHPKLGVLVRVTAAGKTEAPETAPPTK